MFKQFVLNTLRTDTEKLDNVIYHLDGVGELNHLDDILSLEKLKAVQWVFGDGQPPAEEWMDGCISPHCQSRQADVDLRYPGKLFESDR